MSTRFLKKLLYPGLNQTLSDTEKRRLSTLHRAILTSIVVTIGYLVLQGYEGATEKLIFTTPILLTYVICMHLFNIGLFNTSRNLFLISINLYVFLSNYLEYNEAGTFLFYFPIAAGSFFLFTANEKKLPGAFILLPILLFLTSFFRDIKTSDLIEPSFQSIKINFIVSAALSILITIYCIYYYLQLYQKSSNQLSAQNASLESLLHNIGEPVWQIDSAMNLVQYNEPFREFLLQHYGISLQNEKAPVNLLNFESQGAYGKAGWNACYQRVLNNETVMTELLINTADSTSYYKLKLNPIHINKLTSGAVMTLTNLTSRFESEQLLKKNLEEKQKLATIANTIRHSILITDTNLHVTWTNPAFRDITKYNSKEIEHKSFTELLKGNKAEPDHSGSFLSKLQSGKAFSTETVLYKKNKEPFWCFLSSAPVYDENNVITSYIFIGLDITERKRAEEQLQLLLNHAQKLNKELSERDEELQSSIRKLNKQSWEIQVSKQHLQKKKNELEQVNKELNEKARKLEEKNTAIVQQNQELEEARLAISQKAELLEQVSKYKSEFLANMSHELRTPLNSIIILSRLLSENKEGNMTKKQEEFSHVVHKSGTDLLHLINDILDLSKIEAGKIEIENGEFNLQDFCNDIHQSILPAAKSKNIELSVLNHSQLLNINTDELRLSQILKNLLSNAIKFTPATGKVGLTICDTDRSSVIFKVEDNGIGIPADKQKLIFESFQQVDGSISRRFGGTGLGLSISKELTHLLSGQISVKSREGVGSCFTVEIPVSEIHNDIQPATVRHLLIIEDDETFASILEKTAIKEGFKTEKCHRGDTGFMRIKETKPDAIILDMNIPGINGWNLIKKVKADKEIAHIPIHVVSNLKATENMEQLPFVSWFEKPSSTGKLSSMFKDLKKSLGSNYKVLVIEDSPEQSLVVKHLLKKQGISCEIAETGNKGVNQLKKDNFDCIILDLNLPDSDGMTLLKQFKEEPEFSAIPVIVYSSRELSNGEKSILKDYASSYINKNTDQLESLLEETSLFLQSVHEQKRRRQSLGKLPEKCDLLQGKKVLVVDDDIRNIYALSNMLEIYGMEIHTETDGAAAVKFLESNPQTDIVLMDIMMPGMDGYEATKRIRNIRNLSKLPIIAVSAKAMKGDREISLASGLNEHLTKPIEGTQLVNTLSKFFQ